MVLEQRQRQLLARMGVYEALLRVRTGQSVLCIVPVSAVPPQFARACFHFVHLPPRLALLRFPVFHPPSFATSYHDTARGFSWELDLVGTGSARPELGMSRERLEAIQCVSCQTRWRN